MSLWNIFSGRGKEAEEENENAPPFGTGTVDMTTLDITYITHRLLGEWGALLLCLHGRKLQATLNCAAESLYAGVCAAAVPRFKEIHTQVDASRRAA